MEKVHEWQPPRFVKGTSRVRVISDAGKILEWQRIYMEPKAWHALKRLAYKQNLSSSEVVEKLVLLADKVAHQSDSTRRVTETLRLPENT